jgi:hypothetical protein
MTRLIAALLVAPLCVPLMVASHALLLTFQHRDHPEIHYLDAMSLAVWAVLSYGSTLLLGLPLLLFLRWLGLSGLWVAGVVGFFVGTLIWLLAALWYLVAHGVDVRHLARLIVDPGLLHLLWPCGALGAAVGVTFWLIARPDRSSHGHGSANNVTHVRTSA